MAIDNPKTYSHSVRVDSQDLKNLFSLTGQLLILKNSLGQSPEISGIPEPKLRQSLAELNRIIKKIEDCVLSLKLTPAKGLVLKVHRMVSEVSKKSNKLVTFFYEGENTRIDREIMEYLSDIFTHLVRNSIDHGIELPEERKLKGKKSNAEIKLKITSMGKDIIFEFRDDGKGIDRSKVFQKAREKKIIDIDTPFESMSDQKIFDLLFHGGLSTAKSLTDLSGRGVGLEFVKKTVEKLRGKLSISSEKDQGTSIHIFLPMDTSIMDILVAEINRIQYLIALSEIDMVLLKEETMIYTVPKSKRFIIKGKMPIPLIEPSTFFPNKDNKTFGKEAIVIFSYQDQSFGILVDDLIHQTQVVFNPLPGHLISKENFIIGSAAMPTGEVSHILDLPSLVEKYLGKK